MELEKYMKLMSLTDWKARNRERSLKLSKNMKTRVNKFVVAAKPHHRKSWSFSSPFKYDPLKFGISPRPARL